MTLNLKRCPAAVRVFRMVKHHDDHFPPGATKPLPGAFRLTNDDIEDGAKRGCPPLLSVWDGEKATVEQVRALRATTATYTPFAWDVGTIEAIEVPDATPLTVHEDPLDGEDRPGAGAHAGIAGLIPKPKGKNQKEAAKRQQLRLSDTCEPHTEQVLPARRAKAEPAAPSFAGDGLEVGENASSRVAEAPEARHSLNIRWAMVALVCLLCGGLALRATACR